MNEMPLHPVVVKFQNVQDQAAKLRQEDNSEAVLVPSRDVTVQKANSSSSNSKGNLLEPRSKCIVMCGAQGAR